MKAITMRTLSFVKQEHFVPEAKMKIRSLIRGVTIIWTIPASIS